VAGTTDGWQEAVKRDEDSYDHVVNLARETIKELENRQFIKEGQNVATFLDPPNEIIEDNPEDDGFIKQITQTYARVPDTNPDEAEVPLLEPISIPQALGAVNILLSRNLPVAVTATHGLLYIRPEILVLVLFFIRTS
jgi:hypothetical protein